MRKAYLFMAINLGAGLRIVVCTVTGEESAAISVFELTNKDGAIKEYKRLDGEKLEKKNTTPPEIFSSKCYRPLLPDEIKNFQALLNNLTEP